MKVCICGYRRNTPCVYVGREYGGYKGSPLGNPYKAGVDGTLAEVLAMYRKWLWQRISEKDAGVMKALAEIKEGDTLGCWCVTTDTPLEVEEVCHAQVIVKAIRWLRKK